MHLTDTHCHLYFNDYHNDLEAVLDRAWEAGLEFILVPGIDLETSRAALELAETHPRVFAAVGVHPNSALTWTEGTLFALEELAAHPKVVAIGEIGLDYYRDRSPRPLQRRIFRAQLQLAARRGLPVVVHTRNASPEARDCIRDVLTLLREARPDLPSGRPGVIHSFSGNAEEAAQALTEGYYLGFTGPVTYKKAAQLRQMVAGVPSERLLVETDGPFLTPHPYRGRRNEPAYVRYIVDQIAVVQGRKPEEIAAATAQNARHLFRWRELD
ncbi:MAG: TatD family deoxyribonuclease [Anaerolineae bacterium]|nr:MAG: TatD family deoxyribonuclease [Anaerolineae bacterium]